MKLTDNPIFITQQRLTHRAGVLAPILIAALIGVSLLAGFIAYFADPQTFSNFRSPQEAGKMFYAWVIGVEILVLVVGGFSKISRTLSDERKAGLWDSNCLTPLKPSEIVTGYWLGAALREFYMAAILAGVGLVIVVMARLPILLWPGTQLLIFSTALFFGLLAALVGMAFQKPQTGILMIGAFFVFFMPAISLAKYSITNFLLPVYSIANFFVASPDAEFDWRGWPEVFGLAVPPILLTLGLQTILGIFLWRAAVRKTANPFQPLLLRWEAISIFALLVIAQHALVWKVWHGAYGLTQNIDMYRNFPSDSLLPGTQGATILLGVVILAFACPLPERVRVEALRAGGGNLQLILSKSSVSLALALVAALASLMHFASSLSAEWIVWLIAAANVCVFYVMFSLLLEFCRLRHKRRALGFVALWLFVLCILPFVLAAVFSIEDIAKISFFAPGVVALSESNTDLKFLMGVTFAHVAVVVVLYLAWRRRWKFLLANTSAVASDH